MEYSVIGYPLSNQGARDACKGFGPSWSFGEETKASLSCAKPPATPKDICNNCSSYRLLVWEDGADERGRNLYSTVAGQYYGGYSPCTRSNNLPYCGDWNVSGILLTHNKFMILTLDNTELFCISNAIRQYF